MNAATWNLPSGRSTAQAATFTSTAPTTTTWTLAAICLCALLML